MRTPVKLLHPSKAYPPIESIVLGKTTLVMPVQPEKQFPGITCTLSPIFNVVIDVRPIKIAPVE